MLLFLNHWQVKHEEELFDHFFDRLGKVLGTTWTFDDLNSIKSSSSEKIIFPLSFVIDPDMKKKLKGMLSSSSANEVALAQMREETTGEEFVAVYDMPKEEAMKIASKVRNQVEKMNANMMDTVEEKGLGQNFS